MEGSTKLRHAVNWRQAAGEALLIFFGVGVALLGQAAWEARVERDVVRQHIASLLDELRANRDGLREFVDVHDANLRVAARTVRLIGEPRSAARDDSLVAAARQLVVHNYFVPATAAMSNLMGAGGLGLLRDPDLRLRVTRYARSVESFNSFAADLSGFQLREMRPTLGRIVPLADRRMSEMMTEMIGDDGVRVPESAFRADPSILRTVQFENLALFRLAYEGDIADAVDGLLAEVEELIELLEPSRRGS